MAMLMAIPIFLPAHLIMGLIISVLNKLDHMKFKQSHVALFVLHFIFCFVKALR
jgi:hypothetical protein